MPKELAIPDRLAQQQQVIELYLKGENPTTIAKQLGIRRMDALAHVSEWREYARNDPEVKGRARDALAGADQHFNMLIKRSWETVEQTDMGGDYKTKATVLKNIADMEAKRVDMLQKAGLLDDAELGDAIAATEEKLSKIKQLLKETSANCNTCRIPVSKGLAAIFQEPAAIILHDQEVNSQHP